MSCPSASECFAAGFGRTNNSVSAVLLGSTDGGRNWQAETLPSGLGLSQNGSLHALSCPSASECFASGSGGTASHSGAVLLSTSDGGRSWRSDTLPSGLGLSQGSLHALSCPSVSECFSSGYGRTRGYANLALLRYGYPMPASTVSPVGAFPQASGSGALTIAHSATIPTWFFFLGGGFLLVIVLITFGLFTRRRR